MLKAISLLLFAVAPAMQAADSYVIQTIAGTSDVGDNGPASAALLLQPEGITIDALGNIYVADAADNRVRKIAPNGIIRTIAGNGVAGFSGDGGPATAAQLNHPYGIALDLNGNLYIADLGNARIRKVDTSGLISSVAGGGAGAPSLAASIPAVGAHLASPRNVALDPAGNLYISDFDSHQVYKVDAAGRLTVFAGTGKPGYTGDAGAANLAQLAYPAGLAADALGNVYIADSGNACVRRVWYGAITTAAAKIASPTGVAADAAGRLYVASMVTGAASKPASSSGVAVQVVASVDVASDPGGTLYLTAQHSVQRMIGASMATIAGGSSPDTYANGATAASTRLAGPVAIAQSSAGDLYIAEQGGNRIRKIGANGTMTVVVDDSKKVKSPSGIAVDASGTIYFSDANNAVRRISAGGVLSTVVEMLNAPTCLRIGPDGSLYICDAGNDRILRITPSGSQSLAASVLNPSGLAVTGDGALYVSTGSQVVKFAATGDANTVLDQLNAPGGLAIDATGALMIAESGKNRVLKLGAAGAVSVLAGAGTAGFSGDGGPAASAELNGPTDVATDPAGNILIADTVNNRIRKLSVAPSAADITTPPPTGPTPVTPVALTVVNAASLLPGPVAPSEIVTIFGSGFDAAHTQVTFDNLSASVFYAGSNQLNVLVPAGVKPNGVTAVNVLANGAIVGTAAVNTATANPAIFTTQSGIGPAAALNEDSTIVSGANPAQRGSIVSLFLTGDGQSGGRASATIGGYDSDVFYAGPAPGFPGLTQVNVRVPAGFLPSGDQPVVVKLNGAPTQPGVTIAVR